LNGRSEHYQVSTTDNLEIGSRDIDSMLNHGSLQHLLVIDSYYKAFWPGLPGRQGNRPTNEPQTDYCDSFKYRCCCFISAALDHWETSLVF
jgi:hypothetical protein